MVLVCSGGGGGGGKIKLAAQFLFLVSFTHLPLKDLDLSLV